MLLSVTIEQSLLTMTNVTFIFHLQGRRKIFRYVKINLKKTPKVDFNNIILYQR